MAKALEYEMLALALEIPNPYGLTVEEFIALLHQPPKPAGWDNFFWGKAA